MTDLLHPDIENFGRAGTEAPADVTADVIESDAYLQLRELRDGAYERRRSGARAIAREAFAALQAGKLNHAEYARLFPLPGEEEPQQVASDDRESEVRELDWAERAAGEGVRRPGDEA